MKKCLLFVLIALTISSTAVCLAGERLIIAVNTDAATLDPHVQNDSHSEQVVAMLYNTLLKFEEDGTIVPDLAESYTVSPDKRTWTFELRKGVKFHNGKEMTSADVKGTYDRFMRDDADGAQLVVKEITKMFEAVEVIGKYKVSVTTDKPYGPMMPLLCNRSLAIMDADIIEKHKASTGNFPVSVVGTGSYKIKSWKKDEEIVLVKFNDYFGTPAKSDALHFRVIPEAASRVIALETGEVDFVPQFPAEDMDRLKKSPKVNVIQKASVGARLFRFGCNDKIMKNTKVRQAIVHALDRKAFVDGLFPGMSLHSTGPVTSVVWGYHNFGVIERDLAKSKKLLAEAGYPNGFETKIVTTPRYAKGVELAETISAQLADVGIKAKIEVLEWSVLLPLWKGVTPEVFDQPIFVMGAGTSMMDADGALRGLYTTTETGTNERNYGFYSNKEVDQLVMAGMSETDPELRKELYKKASEILYLKDPVAMWLFDRPTTVAASSKLSNIKINGIGLVFYDEVMKK
ncbi:MAG: hypothetical protein HKM93_11560 [Desulfobacteraceae bacterium]|nr:hypothetical protein [Desulfobacteraceae bacterium]